MNLSNLKIDFSNPRLRIGALILAIGIVGGWAWYNYGISALSEKSASLREKLAEKEAELNKIYAMKRRLNEMREELATYERALDSLRSKFPDKKEIPKLIREITRVARTAQVTTKKFSPLPDSEREYYVENNYSMIVSGGYHELGNFFSRLANLQLIINLSEVKIVVDRNVASAIRGYEEHGGLVTTVETSFRMTTFSSRK